MSYYSKIINALLDNKQAVLIDEDGAPLAWGHPDSIFAMHEKEGIGVRVMLPSEVHAT